MLMRLGHVKNPQLELAKIQDSVAYLTFDHQQNYLNTEDRAPLTLAVVYCCESDGTYISVFPDQSLDLLLGQETDPDKPIAFYQALIQRNQLPSLSVEEPWMLETHREDKPWGAEIWYTGIEARGVCKTNGMPLPWLLDCIPHQITGSSASAPPLLLKILDPLPEPDLGDLYFELHDQKIEVYIVTHIDASVWPNGVGQIRYGFNQSLRQNFESDDAFKVAYLDAVETYQQCRDSIDEILEQERLAAGLSQRQPAPASAMAAWLSNLPEPLVKEEAKLRDDMQRFTYLKDIRVGDVIRVEPFFPHALQHGVRVIEFQTASYERYILSFGQKVLTQDHWDTVQALENAILSAPQEPPLLSTTKDGARVEVIADFSAFTAKRVTLTEGAQFIMPVSTDYCLVIGVSGNILIGRQPLTPETALFLPANTGQHARTFDAASNCTFIWAEPKPKT